MLDRAVASELKVAPSRLAEAIERGFCPRFLYRSRQKRHVGEGGAPQNALHPELVALGDAAEAEVARQLDALGYAEVKLTGASAPPQLIHHEGPRIFARQVELAGNAFADFVVCDVDLQGRKRLIIIECKAATESRARHLIQLGAYIALARSQWDGFVTGLLVRRQDGSNLQRIDLASDGAEAGAVQPFSPEAVSSLVLDVEALQNAAADAREDDWMLGSDCRGCRWAAGCIDEAIVTAPLKLLGIDRHNYQVAKEILTDVALMEIAPIHLQRLRQHGVRIGSIRAVRTRLNVMWKGLSRDDTNQVQLVRKAHLPNPSDGIPFVQVFLHPLRRADGVAVTCAVRIQGTAAEGQPMKVFSARGPLMVDADELADWLALHIPADERLYLHVYTWERRTIGDLFQACEASSRRGRALGRFLGQAHELAFPVGADTQTEPSEDSWTALETEFVARCVAAGFGTTLREATSLRWSAGENFTHRWAAIDEDPASYLHKMLREPATSDLPAPAEPSAWCEFAALHLDALAWIEAQMRPGVDEAPLKREWIGNPLSEFEGDSGASWLTGCVQFQHIEAIRGRNRWLARSLSTPDELVARGEAIYLENLSWVKTSSKAKSPAKFSAAIDIGFSEGDVTERAVESFRERASLQARVLFPYPDDEALGPDDLKLGFVVNGIWKMRGRGYVLDDLNRLCIELNIHGAAEQPEYPSTAVAGDVADLRRIPENGRALCLRDYRVGAERKLVKHFRDLQSMREDAPLRRRTSLARHFEVGGVLPLVTALPGAAAAIARLQRYVDLPDAARASVSEHLAILYGEYAFAARIAAWNTACAIDVATFPAPEVDADKRAQQLNHVHDIEAGLAARLTKTQGPPGTGKTNFASLFIQTFCAAIGGSPLILVTGNTHKSVDNLLMRLVRLTPLWNADGVRRDGAPFHPRMLKLASGGDERSPLFRLPVESDDPRERIFSNLVSLYAEDVSHDDLKIKLPEPTEDGCPTILGCTVHQVPSLLADVLATRTCDLLVVDEASMMLLPPFVCALGALTEDARMLVVGDDRQLGPIIDDSWRADFTTSVRGFRPWRSVYEAADQASGAVHTARLRHSHRLPFDIWQLVRPLYLPELELKGRAADEGERPVEPEQLLNADWQGICVVLHDGEARDNVNEAEVTCISWLLKHSRESAVDPRRLAIVTPYRNQIASLRDALDLCARRPEGLIVDTVEKLQGDERPCVIYSAVGDARLLAKGAGFLIDRRRINVALTRAERRLIVVCSKAQLSHVPADAGLYEEMQTWKRLRAALEPSWATVSMPVGAELRETSFEFHWLAWPTEEI